MLNNRLQKGQAFRLFTMAIGAMLVASIIVVLLNPLCGFYDENGVYSYGGFWWANVISQMVLIAVVVIYCFSTKVNYFEVTSLKTKPKFATTLCALGVGLGVFCVMNPLQMWILKAFEYFGYTAQSNVPIQNDATTIILLIVVVCLLPAIAEEQLFRGAIAGGLKEMGLLGACLVGGALFSIFHMNPSQTIHQFVMGATLTLIVLKSNDLYSAILVHFVNNLAVIVLALALGPENADKLVYDYWYILLLVGLVLTATALYGFFKLTKDNQVKKQELSQEEDGANVLDARQLKAQNKAKNTSDYMILAAGVLACIVIWLTNLSSGMAG